MSMKEDGGIYRLVPLFVSLARGHALGAYSEVAV